MQPSNSVERKEKLLGKKGIILWAFTDIILITQLLLLGIIIICFPIIFLYWPSLPDLVRLSVVFSSIFLLGGTLVLIGYFIKQELRSGVFRSPPSLEKRFKKSVPSSEVTR